MIKAFLDTNVVIDFYQRREPFFTHASIIFELAKNKHIDVAVSAVTIVNCFYLLRKHYDRFTLHQKMRALCQLAHISDVRDSTILTSLEKEWPDFEDCVQYVSALESNYDFIVTRNVSDYSDSTVPALLPEAFLDAITE